MITVDLKWYSGSAVLARLNEYLVIVDAFRATSVVATLLEMGAVSVTPVASIHEALTLAKNEPQSVLVGEERGERPEGFAFGNSPSAIHANGKLFLGKHVIHRSSAGTQAFSAAIRVRDEQQAIYTILASSFLNASAVASYVADRNRGKEEKLTVLCSGYIDKIYALEDELAAGALMSELEKRTEIRMTEIATAAYLAFKGVEDRDLASILRNTRSGAKIVEVGEEQDIPFCARLNLYGAVPLLQDKSIIDAAKIARTKD
ncbi:MAG: 2-phosphosulfolactate phosphatase [Methanomassiliicoccales archaeon]